MNKKLEFTDDKFVLMALFRYSLSRQSYAPIIAMENIKNNWDKLDDFTQKQIKSEIIDESDRTKISSDWKVILDLKFTNIKE